MKKNILLIVNPKSGKMKSKNVFFDIVEGLESDGSLITTYITKSKGDATDIVCKIGKIYDSIVCCGGDGTLNEVVTGMLESETNIPLGYIPAGTTNDFATTMNIPKDINQAIDKIVTGTPKAIDIGMMGDDRYFTYIASFGAFTEASYNAPQQVKNVIGNLAYILEGIKDIANIRSYNMTVKYDDKEITDEFIFGAVSNSTSIGGLVKLNDEYVDLSDGVFEVMLIKNPKTIIDLHKIISSLLYSKFDNDLISFFPAKEIEFIMEKPESWTIDGEFAQGDDVVKVKNIHNAIKLII